MEPPKPRIVELGVTIPAIFDTVADLIGATDPEAVQIAQRALRTLGFAHDRHKKPWGWELTLQPAHAEKFRMAYFNHASLPVELLLRAVGPKLLLIREGARLSFHVHERKDAHLRVVHGRVAATLSPTDEETAPRLAFHTDLVHVPPRVRHRLASEVGWGVVAEISIDADPAQPSDETDERRISDDWGRV